LAPPIVGIVPSQPVSVANVAKTDVKINARKRVVSAPLASATFAAS
jgi:hypothetical protein